ncbi:MAG TPA: 23S rRNA (pseudouridine(1915)-N(3))-methyltransferase RlmH [Acidobacteriaceae bacterium]|jgi:23S rRNA (pseudouridine1915-N3)-methyltransferase|nr:23S rRNA (pseudouridine(1915)-N(3))-methyltransferase RlmH [Acidobacteriaceae bacterium]
MRVWIAAVGAKPRAGFDELASMYMQRMAPYVAGVEAPVFRSEDAFWAAVEKERARTAPRVVLLDEKGPAMESESFAEWLGRERDTGRQLVIFAVGPADGWRQGAGHRVQGTERQGTGYRVQGIEGQGMGKRRIAYREKRTGTGVATAGAGEVVWLSLGPMTMAHELARLVLCEQVYRALTILAGHPYHRGSQ